MANVMVYLLNIVPSGHKEIAEAFALTEREASLHKNLQMIKGQYSEHLRVDRNTERSTVLRYSPTPYELWIDTSSAADMAFRRKVIQKMDGNVKKALDYLAKKHPHGAPKN